MKKIVVASRNLHKIAEFKQIVELLQGTHKYHILGLDDFAGDPPEVEEWAETFTGNAKLKANAIAHWLLNQQEAGSTLVVADDSGLCVDALGGKPGVRSARYAGEGADDDANNRRLVEELQGLGLARSSAHYVCLLALQRVDSQALGGAFAGQKECIWLFEGRWDGEIRAERRGTNGFGYDPHMWIEEKGTWETVAELSLAAKCERSHRTLAIKNLLQALASL